VASFTVSCNTTFGQLGLQIGDQFVPGMARFGIGQSPPIDVRPGAVPSVGPPAGSFQSNQPQFALAGIGQGAVAVTPLQMALVAEGLANGGVILEPHVAAEVRDANDKLVRRVGPSPWMTATTPQVAQVVTQMMIQVVKNGTGTGAQIPGVTVAGKTGTAQSGTNQSPHAWFVAFAPAEAPRYAVAVIVEHGGNAGSEATGGRVAAPIAAQMLKLALGIK
jgi:peptidoglycan glycosyltransferase